MSRYGINYYDLSYYGPDNVVSFVATNFKARAENYGYINLTWNSPYGDWSKIKLVRNSYGYPVNAFDGTALDIKNDGNFVAFKETDPTTFDDNVGLGFGSFYYYSLFVLQSASRKWVRVGDASTVSANDYGYTDLLYNSLPSVHKLSSLGGPVSDDKNTDLYNFLSLFGFQLSLSHTYTNLLVNRYDTQKIGGSLLPAVLQQFGLKYEPQMGYQQARILLRDSVLLNQSKGSSDGLKEFIKAFTGYALPGISTAPNPGTTGLVVGHNLMLDYNDSSFEESIGHWASHDSSASLYCLKQKTISSMALTSNVATLTIGSHSFQVGNKVTITGSQYGLFNVTGVAITAIGANTISFALTGANVPTVNAYNVITQSYPVVSTSPAPYNEPTALTKYPNKQKGILAVKNASTSSGTVAFQCGTYNSVANISKSIPVTAGLVYSFSVYSVAGSTTRTITAGINWYDRFGNFLSSSTGTGTANTTGAFSTRISVANKTAPSTAYYAIPTLSIASSAGSASNEWHYFDCAQFEQSATLTAFDEARQLHITLRANRINELLNPHFAGSTSAAPWVPTGATQVVSTASQQPGVTVYNTNYLTLSGGTAKLETVVTNDFKIGDTVYVSGVTGITNGVYTVTAWGSATSAASSYIQFAYAGSLSRTAVTGKVYIASNSLNLTATGSTITLNSWDNSTTSQLMGIYYPSTEYTFSVYVQGSSTADTVTPFVKWYDSTHTLIGSAVNGATANIVNLAGTTSWDRPYVTALAPSNAAYASVGVTVTTATGHTVIFDSALFENYHDLDAYFDGNGGPGDSTDFTWEGGVANAARSHFYKNVAVVQDRLNGENFTNQLLLGTTVAFYLAQPNT